MDKTLDKPSEEYTNRKGFRALELAATIPLIYTVIHNTGKRKTYFEIDISKSRSNAQSNIIEDIHYDYSRFYTTTQNLYAQYKDAYHKSRLVPRTYFVDGKMKTRWVTEYYWKEEAGIPNHNTMKEWKDETYPFLNKIHNLKSGTLIDLKKRKNITVVEKEANKTAQLLTNYGVYGIQIGLLLGYEELLASLHKRENQTLKESMHELYSSKQMNRRSMFKGIAALIGGATAMIADDYLDDRLHEKISSLSTIIQSLEEIPKMSPNKAFLTYFEENPQDIISKINQKTKASNIHVENRFVNSAFMQLRTTGEKLTDKLEKTFSRGIPDELTTVIKARLAAEKLENSSTKEEPVINVLKEGALSAGVMALIIGLFEGYNVKHK